MIRAASWRSAIFALMLFCLGPPGGRAAENIGTSGLPLPRFVSITADRVNLRTGPGMRYPVAWVFVRRNLPVLVTMEFEHWRKIRDRDGAEGWVHKSLLSGRRYGIVEGKVQTLRRAPRPDAPAVLQAEAGVIGRLLACERDWCEMEVDDLSGWLPKSQLFGALPGEVFD